MSNSLSRLINSDTTPTSSNILSLETLQQQYNNALVNYQQAYQSLVSSIQTNENQTNYIGCYTDCADGRAMPAIDISGNTSAGWNIAWDYNSCGQSAKEQGYQYFGLQYFNQPGEAVGLGQCTVSNDLTTATAQGPATNCGAPDASGNVLGNYCSNAIYSTTNDSGDKSAIENVQYWSNEVIRLNRQIMDLLQKESPYYQGEIDIRQSLNTQLSTNLQELLQEREKVNDYINKYNSFDQGIEETSIVTKQNYFQYILYVIILVIVIVYFFKIVLFTKPQSGGGSGSNSTKMKDILFLLGLMLVFLFSGFFFKQHAGFILILLVVVIFILIQMKLIPNILRF